MRSYQDQLSTLQDLEQTLEENNEPLEDWKHKEMEFARDVMSPDAKSKIRQSPYELRVGKGEGLFWMKDGGQSWYHDCLAPTQQEILAELNQHEEGIQRKRKLGEVTGEPIDGASITEPDLKEGEAVGILTALQLEKRQ